MKPKSSSAVSFWASLPSQRRRKKRKVGPTTKNEEIIFAPESVPSPSPPPSSSSILHHSVDINESNKNKNDDNDDTNQKDFHPLMNPSKGNDNNNQTKSHHDFVDVKHNIQNVTIHGGNNDTSGRRKEERLVRDLLPILRPYIQCGECQQYRNELESVKAELKALKQKYEQLQMTSIAQQAARSIQKQKRDKRQSHTKINPEKIMNHLKLNHPDPNNSTIVPDNIISAPPNNSMTQSKSPDMSQALLEPTVQNTVNTKDMSHVNNNNTHNKWKNPYKVQNTNNYHKRLPIDNISKKSLPHVKKQTKVIPENQNQNRNISKCNPSTNIIKQEEKESTLIYCTTIEEPQSVRNNNNNKAAFKFCEVVRNQKVRKTELKGYTCEECKAFFDATGMDAKELHVKDCSRHRYRFTPPSTPEGFWEMSFADERNQNDQRTSWP